MIVSVFLDLYILKNNHNIKVSQSKYGDGNEITGL